MSAAAAVDRLNASSGDVFLRLPMRDLLQDSQNGLSKRKGESGEAAPVLRLADVVDGAIDESDAREITLTEKEIAKYRLEQGDLLCIRVNGSRNLVGRVVPFASQRRWTYCDHFIRLRPRHDVVDYRYLAHYLNARDARRHIELNMVSSAGQNTVSQGTMLDLVVPLPALPKQRRIVAEIEKQFSRLDEAVANLKRVKANLKHYKASVLKAAVEGRLVPTEGELASLQGCDYEVAKDLIHRILADGRNSWSGRGRYKEPVPVETQDLPILPEGWAWATLAQLATPAPNAITDGPFGSNLKTEHYRETGPRVIRLQNIGDGEFVDEKAHISPEHFQRLKKHEVSGGDLLIATLGDSPPRACVVPAHVGAAIVKADCIRFKPHPSTSGVYLNAALNAPPTRQRTKDLLHGVGRPRLSLGKIKAIPLPVPPAEEQQRISAQLDRLLSVAKEVDTDVGRRLLAAERLRSGILENAFPQ